MLTFRFTFILFGVFMASVFFAGSAKADHLNNDSYAYANNLGNSSNICPILPATGIVYFYWNYQNTRGNREKQFQIQVSSNSNFSPAEVDRTFSNLSNDPGTLNQQVIKIKLAVTNPAVAGSNFINYDKEYYWRVKVWGKNELGLSPDWVVGQPYKTALHPGPYPAFSYSPRVPAPQSPVFFNNTSSCYNALGTVVCKSYAWEFGDNGVSSLVNPSHTYNTSGTFQIRLQARDNKGNYCEVVKSLSASNATSRIGLPFWKEISPYQFTSPGSNSGPSYCLNLGSVCFLNSDCCSNKCDMGIGCGI